jgi:hypothetical protein
MRQRDAHRAAEQLTVGFDGLEPGAEPIALEPPIETMRQIVSVRMPDALVERLEAAARARGVSPSSLLRSFVAAGLDRSWGGLPHGESALTLEVVALRTRIEQLLARLAGEGRLEDRLDAGDHQPERQDDADDHADDHSSHGQLTPEA